MLCEEEGARSRNFNIRVLSAGKSSVQLLGAILTTMNQNRTNDNYSHGKLESKGLYRIDWFLMT